MPNDPALVVLASPQRKPTTVARLSLDVLGSMRVTCEGREVRIRGRKARAILAYLAIEEACEETRERLVGLLWSETGEDKARASLRQVVHELREALQEAGYAELRAERMSLSLLRGSVSLDLRDVQHAAENGMVHPMLLDVPQLSETLLQGLDDLDPAFRVWVLARRQRFHDQLMRLLEPTLRQPDVPPEHRLRSAQAILKLDPTHEEACRTLMLAYAQEGDSVAALRTYESLWRVLDEEYDSEPAAATQQLVADIKIGKFEPPVAPLPAPSRAAPPPPRPDPLRVTPPRIALLVEPFAINGVPMDRAHLVEGFRHDLIARLVRFREWFVVNGSTMPPQEQMTGRVSGCYRIGASAYQVGERISMVLTLAEHVSGIFVWSERLELKLDGWFETQQQLLRRIAAAMNLQISSARLAETAADPDMSVDGYDRWLRCQQMLLSFSPQDWGRAFEMLEEMAERAPAFAPAYSNMAQLDNVAHIIRPGVFRTREREERSLHNARMSVERDPMDSRSQLCLGWSLALVGRHAQADVHMRLALDLNPDDSWLLMSLALFFAFSGDHDMATEMGRQSLEATLVPTRTQWGFEVTNAYLRGDDAAALHACDQAEDVIRTLQAWRAAALFNLGRHEEARAAADRFRRMIGASWFGTQPPTDALMTRWLLHLYPIRRAEDWERLRAGVAGAGLPTEGLAHGDW